MDQHPVGADPVETLRGRVEAVRGDPEEVEARRPAVPFARLGGVSSDGAALMPAKLRADSLDGAERVKSSSART